MSNIVDKVGAKPINLTLANNTVENLRTGMTIPCKMAIATDTKQLCITDDEGDFHKIVNDTADEETYTRIQNGYVIVALHGDDGTVSITGNLEVANATGNIDLTDDSIKISNDIIQLGNSAGNIKISNESTPLLFSGKMESANEFFIDKNIILNRSEDVSLVDGGYPIQPNKPLYYITESDASHRFLALGYILNSVGTEVTIVRTFPASPDIGMVTIKCGVTGREYNITDIGAMKFVFCGPTLGWVKYI